MDEILSKAKELGILMKERSETHRMKLAEVAMSANFELQKKIKEFDDIRQKVFEMMNEGVEDKTIIDPLNEQLKELYSQITAHPVMVEFDAAKKAFEDMSKKVNNAVQYEITGEIQGGCSASDCASCSGCTGS